MHSLLFSFRIPCFSKGNTVKKGEEINLVLDFKNVSATEALRYAKELSGLSAKELAEKNWYFDWDTQSLFESK